MSVAVYIAVMAGVTYLIRVIPFAMVRKKIKSEFIKSLLYYMPYAILSAMTFPAIFYSTGNTVTAGVGTVTAIVLAYFDLPLMAVAISAAAAAFGVGFLV